MASPTAVTCVSFVSSKVLNVTATTMTVRFGYDLAEFNPATDGVYLVVTGMTGALTGIG